MVTIWKPLFSDVILNRGEQYFRNHAVYALKKDPRGNKYTAIVTGNLAYSVSITLGNGKVSKMSCNCPHAKDGYRCKHMAAVLFAMEDKGMIQPEKEKLPAILPLTETTEYQFYNLQYISSDLVFYQEEIDAAQAMIARGDITITSIQEGFISDEFGQTMKMCAVRCSMKGKTTGAEDTLLQFTGDSLVYAGCEVAKCDFRYRPDFYYYFERENAACVHVTAAFLLFDEYIQNHQIGDATDYHGHRILERFRQKQREQHAKTAAESGQIFSNLPVTLEPRLEIDNHGMLKLSFKVGDQKLYVVKKLKELVDCVEGKQQMRLGKNAAIDFAVQSFDDTSLVYYEMIRKELKMDELRAGAMTAASRGYYDEQEEMKNSIPLYGARLDQFFEFTKGKTVPYVDKRKNRKDTGFAEVRCGKYDATIRISKDTDENGLFEGIHVKGDMPGLVPGIEHQYTFEQKTLLRIEDERLDILKALMFREDGNKIDFVVGRKSISEFCHRILPQIEQQTTVDFPCREEVQQYLQPEGRFVFYLDAEADNVTCLPKVFYDEVSFDFVMDHTEHAARDHYREEEILEVLQNYFPYTDPEDGVLHCDADESLIFQVLCDGVNALLELGEVQASEQFNRLTIRRKPQISVGVQMESDLLNLTVTSSELSEDELVELLRSYRKKKKYHRLRNGDFVRVDDENMEELSHMLEVMKISLSDFVKGKMQIPAYRALYLDKLLEKNDALYAKRDKNFKNLIKDFKTVSDSDYEAPESLQGIMRNYQDFGYKWLRTVENCRFGGILADDMGLGKTLQMISLLLSAKEEGRLESALIVTPASLVYNWQAEFEKFAPALRVQTITGTKSERESKLAVGGNVDVFITSYDLLKRDIKAYEDLHFTYQVIDEAQNIKTHTTAAAKSVKVINSDVRFALTGTPIENRLSELWSIFDYLMPGFLYPYDRFRREFETPIVKNKDDSAMQRLKRMVEPFILRRLKGDVLADLPEKIEEVHYVQFEPEQQKLYDGQAAYMKQMIEGQNDEAFQKGKIQILAELTKIRQICCDPGLCFENYNGESAKRAACMELIQSAIDGEHKVLLFSQFTSLLAMMEEDLRVAGIAYYKITGETKKEDRIQMVNQFNADDTPVFLVSLKAGGTGLNLTGADIVIHFDPWWNLAAQNQATDRAHRIGQTRTVSVYKLIAKNSIEEKLLGLQEQKGQLADEILAGKEGGLMTMSREELLELL